MLEHSWHYSEGANAQRAGQWLLRDEHQGEQKCLLTGMVLLFGVIGLFWNKEGVMYAQLWEHIKNHRIIQFKRMNFMVCELCLNFFLKSRKETNELSHVLTQSLVTPRQTAEALGPSAHTTVPLLSLIREPQIH